ncbi:MAG TPA: serine/threonine-protein kinase [Chthoniobacter sp.]
METPPNSAPATAAAPSSRWARVVHGEREALRELGDSYWYCAYAWLRRAGLDQALVVPAVAKAFSEGFGESLPEGARPSCRSRLREWLPARLREIKARDEASTSEAAMEIDVAWAEACFGQEPAGAPDTIFHRRWALTILEFTMETIREEYVAAGQEGQFAELAPFVGFDVRADNEYQSAASRMGITAGAARKAVFEFRSRHREVLRAFVGDTVLDPAEIDNEITALLCACDAPGASPSLAPLPEAIRRLKPDQLLVRAMHSVRMTNGGSGLWTPPTNEEVAHLFPQYEMVGMIGRGGMGAVYKARQVSLDRFVAIKLLPLEVSVDPEFSSRFVREAQTMARLNHPNIIAVHDFGKTTEGHLYFVMEYVEGEDLHEIIYGRRVKGVDALGSPQADTVLAGAPPTVSDERPVAPADGASSAASPGRNLTPERALEIISGICDALHYAHGKGVIHRDVKPANVMVDREGRVKVADFGLARADVDLDARGRTAVGAVLGTPDYMAPEQMRGIRVDQRADVFSVGVVLYEMLCHALPRGIFAPPASRLGLDLRIDDVLSKAMQQEAERRYQNALEMKAEVDRILKSPAERRLPSAKEIAKYSFRPVAAAGSRAGSSVGLVNPPPTSGIHSGDHDPVESAETAEGEEAGEGRSPSGVGWVIVILLLILAALGWLLFYSPAGAGLRTRFHLPQLHREFPVESNGLH